MPPSYKPLPTDTSGVPAAIFGDQPINLLQMAEAKRAELLAAQLNNQVREQNIRTNDISLQQAERQNQQQQNIQDALAAKFGNMPEGQPVDLNEMYKAGMELAVKYGDLGLATDMQRAQNNYAGNLDRPIPADKLDIYSQQMGGVKLPEGTTIRDLNTMGALSRGEAYITGIDNTQKRFDIGIQSTAPGNLRAKIDPQTGQAPNKDDGKIMRIATDSHTRIQQKLIDLERSFKTSDPNDPFGKDFMKQRALLGEIQKALKDKENFGAALTLNEERLMNIALPRVFARDDISLAKGLADAGLGRDPTEAIINMRKMLQQDYIAQAHFHKYEIIPPNEDAGVYNNILTGLWDGEVNTDIQDAMARANARGDNIVVIQGQKYKRVQGGLQKVKE